MKFCENFCLRCNRQTWQSYQICQTKIMSPFDKNSLSKPNLKPQFIIGGWSEAGGFYTKITQNCQISQWIAADLCNIIFNGIYCFYTYTFMQNGRTKQRKLEKKWKKINKRKSCRQLLLHLIHTVFLMFHMENQNTV